MTRDGGREMLREALQAAIEATRGKDDAVSKGIYALCLDRLSTLDDESRPSSWIKCGPVEASGYAAVVLAIVYLMLRVHGLM